MEELQREAREIMRVGPASLLLRMTAAQIKFLWINGVQEKASLMWVEREISEPFSRMFENINYIGIGLHKTLESNATSYFVGISMTFICMTEPLVVLKSII